MAPFVLQSVSSARRSTAWSETSNNQRLERGVRCVLLLYNWYLRVFFDRPPTREVFIITFFWVWILLVWHRIDTFMRSRPSVSVSPRWRPKHEMTWHTRWVPAGHRKTRGTEERCECYAFCLTQKDTKMKSTRAKRSVFNLQLKIGTSASEIRRQNWTFVVMFSRRSRKLTTGHLTSLASSRNRTAGRLRTAEWRKNVV